MLKALKSFVHRIDNILVAMNRIEAKQMLEYLNSKVSSNPKPRN
jgi:hypothetical protein